VVTIAPASALAAVVAGASSTAGAAFIAAVVGSVSYIALFIAIGCITRRTAVWSLAIVFLVERLLGAALTGIAQLSPTWESRAIFLGYLDDPPSRLIRSGIPQGGAAVVRLAIFTVVALVIANWRMARMRLSGAAD
jgi:ABC-type transport system involved in multi-copper enzyme maturation permease subunit